MKKLIAASLSLALMLSMASVTAFAETITSVTSGSNTASKAVTATYDATRTDTYSVGVSWGDMAFTYTPEKYIWNDSTHQYDAGGNGTWTCVSDANKVTVTNNSNASVNVAIAYSQANMAVTGAIKTTDSDIGNAYVTKTLESAFQRQLGADSTAAYLRLSGNLDGNAANLAKGEQIGTITVTISAPSN